IRLDADRRNRGRRARSGAGRERHAGVLCDSAHAQFADGLPGCPHRNGSPAPGHGHSQPSAGGGSGSTDFEYRDDGSSHRVVHGQPPVDDAAAGFVRGGRAAPGYGWHLRGDCVFRCAAHPGTGYPARLGGAEPRYYVAHVGTGTDPRPDRQRAGHRRRAGADAGHARAAVPHQSDRSRDLHNRSVAVGCGSVSRQLHSSAAGRTHRSGARLAGGIIGVWMTPRRCAAGWKPGKRPARNSKPFVVERFGKPTTSRCWPRWKALSIMRCEPCRPAHPRAWWRCSGGWRSSADDRSLRSRAATAGVLRSPRLAVLLHRWDCRPEVGRTTRDTRLDVDLTLLTGFGSEDTFIDALLGVYPGRVDDARELARRYRVLLLSAPGGIGMDISLGALAFEESVVSRATGFSFSPGVEIRTCSAEDLVVLKLFAARPLDIRDAEGVVIRQGDDLDWRYIEDQLRPLAEVKQEPEILRTLSRLRRL